MIAPADSTEEQLAERMQEVRRRGHANAYHLRVGVDRVSDWKEHVKAYPIPAVVLAAVVGYWATSKLIPAKTRTKSRSERIADEQHQEVVTKSTATAGIAAFAGSLASNLIRQYARGYLDNYIQSLTHKGKP